jgi:ankyrin repeat protein
VVGADEMRRSPLHYAALRNDIEAAQDSLQAGDAPDLEDVEGFTPLHFAAQEWSVEVAELLLDHGARVDATNRYGNTPLWVAVFNSRGRGELIRLLREQGADPRKENTSGQTPLKLARSIDNYDVAQYFADIPND